MKQFNNIFHLISLLLVTSSIFGQSPFLRHHNLFKGKEDYAVNKIYQDPKGWIWFGTNRGLFRFDGINLTRYSISEGLADDEVTSICSDSTEKLWIGHKNGELTVYDGHIFKPFSPEEGLGSSMISDIVIDSSGTVWFSTLGEGVYRYDGRYLTNLNIDDGLSDNNVYDIEIENNGNLWFATDNGITRYSSGIYEVISMKDGLSDNIVRVLKTIGDGRIFLGTYDNGIIIYDAGNKTFHPIEGWDFGHVTSFIMGLENELWISTEDNGILQLKLSGNIKPIYKRLKINKELVSNRIYTIIKDQEENIWIGGKQILIQALPPVFEFLNKSNSTPFEMAYSTTKDNYGNMWVCSESGLYRGVPDKSGQFEWANISEKMNLRDIGFMSIYLDDHGQIWAGTYGYGVYRINPENLKNKKYTISDGLSDNNVVFISGNDSLVWFSTFGGGISNFNISHSRLHNYLNTELKNSYVYETASDKTGRIWIAGSFKVPSYIYKDSLYRINFNSEKFTQLYGVTIDTSDVVWFNTQNEGIIKVTDNNIEKLNEKDGIRYKKIQSIIFDKFNNLLIISDFGILFYNLKTKVILEFGENSGLAFQYPILNSTYTDKEGQIWIGTQTGIIKYNPEYLKYVDQNPTVFLSGKDLFSIPIKPGKNKFRYNENNFNFGYTGIWFRNPEGLKYRYMLEGFDLKWNYSNRNQYLPYSKLPPGNYSFKVEVSLDEKNWYSSENSHFSFRVKPPFWRRWWFILGIIIVTLTGIYFYIKLRLSNLEKAKDELEIEVQKRTEEIRNQNEELETQKEEIETQRDNAEAQRDQIELQKEEIQASIRYAHRIQSATLPPKNQLNTVLKDYFILNKPRDIVSGDFYWVAQNGSSIFFSVGDCTGHGVPGSFMSMLGLSALNDIVKSLQTCKASSILNILRERIRESLHQGGESETIANDGMDISLCILDIETNKLQFAGAHNPLYIIRKGEIQIISADKMEIGSFLLEKLEFTNKEIQCERGDQLYLFSDGFPDQFGGKDGKKYKYQKFREFLISIQLEPMLRQKWLLDEEIETWKGSFPQVDDIMVMGVKII
jgi:ligand-binding sensor domain-containing protein/serine phosphatase RsbU (regulator of sigma subunit)